MTADQPAPDSGQQPSAAGPTIDTRSMEREPQTAYWTCSIGPTDRAMLPPGSDLPMRQAVRAAFVQLTGHAEAVLLSGWGQSEAEAAEQARAASGERECRHRRESPCHFNERAFCTVHLSPLATPDAATREPGPHSRFDHDGIWPHHHDADTGDAVFWERAAQDGPRTEHRHAVAREPGIDVERSERGEMIVAQAAAGFLSAAEIVAADVPASYISRAIAAGIANGRFSVNSARKAYGLPEYARLAADPGAEPQP